MRYGTDVQVKTIPMVIGKLIDVHVSIGRLSRFLELPEVTLAPPAPPLPSPHLYWRNVGPFADPKSPLLQLREAAFKWNKAQTGVQASKPSLPTVISRVLCF